MLKEVVVVNFKSPPFIGIGGRRWGKLTKALLNNGVKVHLVRVNWGSVEAQRIPDWMHHPLLQDHVVEGHLLTSSSFFGRMAMRFSQWKASLLGEYSIYDEGRNYIKGLIATLSSIQLDSKIDAYIVTGPPFSWIYEVTHWVKSNAIHSKIWVDIRDPWLTANNWGMPLLSKKQKSNEQQRYLKVLDNADFVSSPTFSILEEFVVGECGAQKVYFPHFFDWDDWQMAEGIEVKKNYWVYSGQFYVGMEEFIEKWRTIIISAGPSFEWAIFSKDHDRFSTYLGDLEQVKIHPDIGNEVFRELARSEGLVICLSNYNKDYFTTKYYDYLPSGKPLMYIGPVGKVAAHLMQDKKNGINVLPAKDNFISSPVVFSLTRLGDSDEIQKASLEARCQELIKLISKSDV